MKFCNMPFRYFYLDDYKGKVALCPWMKKEDVCVGNLTETDIRDIWLGREAERLRDKMRKGDFSSCRLEACPWLQNRNLPDVDEAFAANYPVASTPREINMAFDFMCNQYCETCRSAKFRPILPRYRNYMEAIHRQIVPFLNKAIWISASGHGDPFASPYMMKILQSLQPEEDKVRINLETNGVYFDERHWQKISHLKKHDIIYVVTINSFDEFVYNHISRGGKYDRAMENLDFARQLRERNDLKKFIIAFVIQDRNFRELPGFIERCITEYNVDEVVLKPVYQWGTMPPDVFWFKDVLNPMHPYHKEYLEILDMPIMNDPRVFNFGGRTMHEAAPFPGHSEGC